MKIKKKIVCSMLLAILCLTGCNSANNKVGDSKVTENANAEYTPVSYTHLTLPTNREV